MQKLQMLALFVTAAVSAPTLCAQNATKIAIELVNRSEDSVGGRLILRIKEKLKESNIFRLATESEPRMQIIINSIDQDRRNEGLGTAYSIIWTYTSPKENPIPFLLNNTIGLCGSSRIDDVADSTLANTDKLVETMRQMFAKPAQK